MGRGGCGAEVDLDGKKIDLMTWDNIEGFTTTDPILTRMT